MELGVFLLRGRRIGVVGHQRSVEAALAKHRERKWTQPLCSSSSSWCCCSAAADFSTDAGLESKGRLARRDHSPLMAGAPLHMAGAPLHGLSPILARSATVHIVRSTIDTLFHGPFAGYTVFRQAKIAAPQGRSPRTPVAATQIDAGDPLPLCSVRHTAPKTVGRYG